ncbi:hypothetical protein D3C80_1105730 [compost metagenome]
MGTLHQVRLAGRQRALAQGGDQQTRGVERLQQVVAGRGQVLVLALVGRLGGVARLAQLALDALALADLLLQVAVGLEQLGGARGDALLQLDVELLLAQLGLLALGDVGDEALDQPFLVGLEQQVHQHVDAAAVAAAQARLVAVQAVALAQHRVDPRQLGGTADEQLLGQIGLRPQHLLRIFVTEHVRQRRVGGEDAVVQAHLEDAVHRMLEQPLVAVALALQLLEARRQLRVVALARRVTAEAKQVGNVGAAVRELRHTPPRRRAGSTVADWSGCTGPASRAATGRECPSCPRRAA